MRGKRLISFLCAAAMTVSAFAGLTVTASAQGTDSYALAAAETHEVTITPDSSGAAKVLVNTTETTPLSGVLIHATYTADNKLESVEAKDFTIADAAGVNVDLKKAYSVGDKIFVWNSLSGMVPYKADVIILIPTETGAPAYNATGKVVDKDGNPLAGAEITVSVPDGEDIVVTADSEGNYTIPELPAGNYQVVVEYTPDGGETQTVTEALEITDKDVDKTITLPDANVNSALVVEEDTPDVIVDGLTDTAIDEAKDEGEKKVTVTMTVARQPEDLTDPEQKAIKDIATEEETIEYLDISLIKTVEDETGEKTDEEIDETAKAITLAVAMDTTDKHDIVVYRYHDGVATALSQTPVDGEYYEVTDDFVKIHANKFSVYAIAYKTGAAPVVTATPVQTETPVVTATPVQTEAPVVTDTPTEAPTVVPTTAVTTAPTTAPTVVPTTAVTTAPSGTEAPVVRPTSRPTSDIKTVAITGTAAVGETLKANVTPAEAQTGVAYQWSYSDDGETYTDIAGATSDTFTIPATVPAEDEEDEDIPLLGKTLKVTVTVPETNLNFTGGPLEAETKAIVNAAISGTIEIAGEGNIGKVLTATVTGVPEGSKIEWQYNDGTGYKELVAAADVTVPALSATPTPEETAADEAAKKAVEAAKQYTIASPLKAGDKIRAVIKSDSKSGQIESNEITVLSATSGKIAKSSTTDATLTGTAPTAITAATNLTAEGTDVENNGVITLEGDLDYRNFPGFSGIQSEQFGYYTAYDIIFPSNFDNENGVVVLTGSTDKTVTAANFDGTDKDRLTIIKHLTAAKVQANPTEKVELYNTADTSGTPVYTYNIDFTELNLYAKVTSSAPISDVSAAKAEADDTVTFKVTPTTGRLKAGSVAVKSGDDDIAFTEEDGVYSFTMPDKDVTISAETESIPSSKITFTSTAFGSVTVNAGRNLATGEQVASGTTVTVNAQPAGDAYELTSLTVGGESVTPENGIYSFTMGDEAVEINAAFARKTIASIEIKGDDLVKKGKTAPYTVVVTAVDGTDITSAVENNEVSWAKTGTAEGTLSSTAGKSINLTVGANEETASDAKIILTASIPGTSATDSKTVTPVDADTYPINISATNATVTTDPNGSQVGKGVVTVTVEPDLGYVLTNSSVAVKNSDTGDEIEYEGEDGTYTFTMPEDKGATITVSTTAIQYDIVVADADNGSASVYPTKPAGVKYTAADIESKVKVYPIADTGYEIAGVYVGAPEDEYELTDKDTDGGYIISLEDLVEGSDANVLTITPVFEAKKNTVKIVGNTDAVSYKTSKGNDTEVEVAYGDTFTLVQAVDATAEEALEEGYPTVTYVDANGATQTLEPATGGVYTMPDADVTVTVKTVTKSYEVVVTYDPDAFNGNDGSIKLRVWDAEKEDFVGNSIAGETDTEANTVTFDVPAGTYKVVFTDALNDNYIDPVAATEPVTVSATAATASLTATATRQYVVTFDADGGTFTDASGSTTEPKVIKVNIDETFTDNVPDDLEKDNYYFEGWKKVDAETDEVTGDNIDFDTETVEEDTTYRAVWTKVSGITINVPANKGESAIKVYDGDTELEGTGLRNVKEGTTITVVIIPDTANNYTYEPDTISVKETVSDEAVETTEVEDNSAIKYNFEMPGESVTVTAGFRDPVAITFVDVEGQGAVSAATAKKGEEDAYAIESGDKVIIGATVSVTITPTDNYYLTGLTVADPDDEEATVEFTPAEVDPETFTYTFTAPDHAVAVTPSFTEKTYSIVLDLGEGTAEDTEYGEFVEGEDGEPNTFNIPIYVSKTPEQADITEFPTPTAPEGKIFIGWEATDPATATDPAGYPRTDEEALALVTEAGSPDDEIIYTALYGIYDMKVTSDGVVTTKAATVDTIDDQSVADFGDTSHKDLDGWGYKHWGYVDGLNDARQTTITASAADNRLHVTSTGQESRGVMSFIPANLDNITLPKTGKIIYAFEAVIVSASADNRTPTFGFTSSPDGTTLTSVQSFNIGQAEGTKKVTMVYDIATHAYTINIEGVETPVTGTASVPVTGIYTQCEKGHNPGIANLTVRIEDSETTGVIIDEVEGGKVTADTYTTTDGGEIILTATPEEGKKLASVTVTNLDDGEDEITATKQEDGTFKFTTTTAANVEVTPVFSRADVKKVEITSTNNTIKYGGTGNYAATVTATDDSEFDSTAAPITWAVAVIPETDNVAGAATATTGISINQSGQLTVTDDETTATGKIYVTATTKKDITEADGDDNVVVGKYVVSITSEDVWAITDTSEETENGTFKFKVGENVVTDVAESQILTVETTPNEGYAATVAWKYTSAEDEAANWTTLSEAPFTITGADLTGDIDVKVTFTAIEYTITNSSSDDVVIKVDGVAAEKATIGQIITVEPKAESGKKVSTIKAVKTGEDTDVVSTVTVFKMPAKAITVTASVADWTGVAFKETFESDSIKFASGDTQHDVDKSTTNAVSGKIFSVIGQGGARSVSTNPSFSSEGATKLNVSFDFRMDAPAGDEKNYVSIKSGSTEVLNVTGAAKSNGYFVDNGICINTDKVSIPNAKVSSSGSETSNIQKSTLARDMTGWLHFEGTLDFATQKAIVTVKRISSDATLLEAKEVDFMAFATGIDTITIQAGKTYGVTSIDNFLISTPWYDTSEYTITNSQYADDGNGNTIAISVDGGSEQTTEEVTAYVADAVTVVPHLAAGYYLTSLTYNDGAEHDITESRSFDMPNHAVTVAATYAQSLDINYTNEFAEGADDFFTTLVSGGTVTGSSPAVKSSRLGTISIADGVWKFAANTDSRTHFNYGTANVENITSSTAGKPYTLSFDVTIQTHTNDYTGIEFVNANNDIVFGIRGNASSSKTTFGYACSGESLYKVKAVAGGEMTGKENSSFVGSAKYTTLNEPSGASKSGTYNVSLAVNPAAGTGTLNITGDATVTNAAVTGLDTYSGIKYICLYSAGKDAAITIDNLKVKTQTE